MLKKIAAAFVGSMVLIAIGFFVWALWIPQPMPEAVSALSPSESVDISFQPYLRFKARNTESKIGLVIYPGARVDNRAYAPLAKRISESGVMVILPTMPLNLAIFARDRAAAVQAEFPEVEKWFVGGHSLGGTMAASFAENYPVRVRGLILIASYPMSGSKLSGMNVPVISIFGSNDGIATIDEIAASKTDLPAATRFVEIKGGNHAQFGWYGEQSGDGIAAISRDEQTLATADLIVQFIRDNSR